MNTLQNHVNNLHLRQWKPLGFPYEPVGLTVLLLCENGEVVKGYRKKPCETKKDPLVYYRESDGSPVEGALGWDIV